MAVQDAKRLRELVSDYYHGLITPESYRQQRAKLLDSIGETVVPQLETTTDARPVPLPAADAVPKPSATTKDSQTAAQRPLAVVLGAIAVLGVGIVTVLLLTRSPDSDQSEETSPQRADMTTDRVMGRGDSLLQDFLSRSDWSGDSLANFATAWRALEDDQRNLAAEGRQYRRLTSALHQRIREESAIGAEVTVTSLQQLIELAIALGAPYRETSVVVGVSERQTESTLQESEGSDTAEEPDNIIAAVTGEQRGDIAAVQDADVIEGETLVTQEPETSAPALTTESAEADAGLAPAGRDKVTPTSADVTEPDDPCSAELASSRRPYCRDTLSKGSEGPLLVVLPAGDFEMGGDHNNAESPVHRVTISKSIAMSRDEISSADFEQFCTAANQLCPDKTWGSDHYPVVMVSWDDALSYTEWLTEQTGQQYRLPSEAEWEFAARAGTKSPYYFGDEITPSAAHSSANGPVDSPLPRTDRSVNRNAFRLYHMSGNVREWVQDVWHPSYEGAPYDGSARTQGFRDLRVVRGGSYTDIATKLRSAAREPLDQSHRDGMTGFRVVREVMQQATEK